MRIHSFDVQGFSSLKSVLGIPVRWPTILTGHNDAGKSTSLSALAFLLNKYEVTPEDFTLLGVDTDSTAGKDASLPVSAVHSVGQTPVRVSEIIVTGHFELSVSEQQDLQLPKFIKLRRKTRAGERPVYEVMRQVPREEDLRGVADMRMVDLKNLALPRGISPDGPGNKTESWRGPLLKYISGQPQINGWDNAARSVIDRLPIFLCFSSTEEPNPEVQIRQVMQARFERLLSDAEFVGTIKQLEDDISSQLQNEAEQLCKHIQQHVPELKSVSAIPVLSFRQGLSAVNLRASNNSGEVGLQHAGAGRQRRISLAVWEWTSDFLSAPTSNDMSTVIAYDEPDTHLDYRRQRDLMDVMRAQCENPTVSMIVATHSINLIDRVDISDVVQMELDSDGHTVAHKLMDDSHDGVDRYLSGISTALGLRTSVLLHERCFLAVEGPTEYQTFPRLFRLATGQHLQSAGIVLLNCDNNDGALKVTKFLVAHRRRVVFLVDKDSATNASTKRMFSADKLRGFGITDDKVHYIGDPNELEELYGDSQWADTANEVWPRKDGRDWTKADIASVRESGKFSDKLKSLFRDNSKEAPSSKQEMNLELVLRLKCAEEVPDQLRQKFEKIKSIAELE